MGNEVSSCLIPEASGRAQRATLIYLTPRRTARHVRASATFERVRKCSFGPRKTKSRDTENKKAGFMWVGVQKHTQLSVCVLRVLLLSSKYVSTK